MKFFIPDVDDPDLAERIYQSAKIFAKTAYGFDTTERRIFSIAYTHNGKHCHDEVGKMGNNKETIMAILESGSYLVCTLNSGVYCGMPMLVGKHKVTWVRDFD